MRRFLVIFLSVFSVVCFCASTVSASLRDTIDLKGKWYYRLREAPVSIPAEGMISIPGTLDTNRKGIHVPESDNTSQLSRLFNYSGDVSYVREVVIPESWKDKEIELFIERTRPTRLKIDGHSIGINNRISSPQRYNLTGILTPGKHRLHIIVNNSDSIPDAIRRNSNESSEYTQTSWNGMLGKIHLEAKDRISISYVKIIPDYEKEGFEVELSLSKVSPKKITVEASVPGGKIIKKDIKRFTGFEKLFIPWPKSVTLWSEYTPQVLPVTFSLKDGKAKKDELTINAGASKFAADGSIFRINEDPVFLRGTVNSAVFPLTGHPPMEEEWWDNYFKILKNYGFNHVRFHTWTPPEAAFTAADKIGIYIQAELPLWGEFDRDRKRQDKFLRDEMEGILLEYSSHPSFVMFSLGNELWGDISLMQEYLQLAKIINPKPLMTTGSNVYLGLNGPLEGDEFLVASRIGEEPDGMLRGSFSFADMDTGGILNSSYPNSIWNYSEAVKKSNVPVISHEVGQYQTYPDFNERLKYVGIFRADNFNEFERRAREAGTFIKNEKYHEASGKAAVNLYKRETEAAFRTPGMGGFQLFGLQDYPGQGTALVGLLDAFMDSKGIVSEEEWRRSCADLVILAEFPKFSFHEEEEVEISLLAANFTSRFNPLDSLIWSTSFDDGVLHGVDQKGISNIGKISLTMPKVKIPVKETLILSSPGGEILNSYDFYVYPEKKKHIKNVTVTSDMEEALRLLEKGGRVILYPDSSTVKDASIGPLYINDFWNYRLYRTICDKLNLPASPGSLGMFIDDTHPAFELFPTESYTDVQWYPIIANSRPLIIDRLPKDVDPIVEVIDNTERNFRLALILECNVEKGKLLIISSDMEKASQYPEGEWLLQSLTEYMGSKNCKPEITLTPQQVINLLTKPSDARRIKELKNEIYDSKWE